MNSYARRVNHGGMGNSWKSSIPQRFIKFGLNMLNLEKMDSFTRNILSQKLLVGHYWQLLWKFRTYMCQLHHWPSPIITSCGTVDWIGYFQLIKMLILDEIFNFVFIRFKQLNLILFDHFPQLHTLVIFKELISLLFVRLMMESHK